MTLPKPAIWVVYAILATAIISGSFWFDARHRADVRLDAAHLTYSRGCSGCERSLTAKPNFQVDLFGDGTVVFQEDTDSDGKSFVTHLDARDTKAFFKALNIDAYWQEAPDYALGIDAPHCIVSFVIDSVERNGGCYRRTTDKNGLIFLTQPHPKIAQLEALIGLQRLQSFDHWHLPSGITVYKPSARYAIELSSRIPPPPPPLTH